MADGKKANLPGSMLTNDLGDEVTIDTKWTWRISHIMAAAGG